MAVDLELLLLRGSDSDSVASQLSSLDLSAIRLGGSSGLLALPVDERVKRLAVGSDPDVPGFQNLTASVADLAAALSMTTRVAYLHVEFFGGLGFHAAIGWSMGQVGWGPRFTATQVGEGDQFAVVQSTADMAANQVLRWLGITAVGELDEYATVGLDRCRWTDDRGNK